MKITLETVADFEALPSKVQSRILEIIKFSTLVNGMDSDMNTETAERFSQVCGEMIEKIENHPEVDDLSRYVITPWLTTELTLRVLSEHAKGFLQ